MMAEDVVDDDELAQWMPECDDCDNPAEHICKTCGDKLCTGCKDQHLSRKKNRDHQVVPYSEGIELLKKSKSSCPKHPGENYQVYCKPCDVPVCTPCISESHGTKDHELISIADAFSMAKDKATLILGKMMTIIRPSLKEVYGQAKESLDAVQAATDRAENDMRSNIQRLHKELDLILDQNLNKLKEMKEESLVPLKRDLQRIDDMQARLEENIKEYENNLRSDDPIELITFMRKRKADDPDAMFPLPVIEDVCLPEFHPNEVSRDALENLFGKLSNTTKKEGERERHKNDIENYNSDSTNQNQDLDKHDNRTSDDRGSIHTPVLHVMSKAVRQSEFSIADKLSHNLCGLRCQGSDSVWIAGNDNRMYLVDRTGSVILVIKAGCSLYSYTGLCVTNEHELIFSDRDGKTLKKISHDHNVTTLFNTGNYRPCGLSQCPSGDLVVCLPGEKVVRVYNVAGKVIKDIGKDHLQQPYYVTVNRTNDDVCVSDTWKKVVVFRSSGQKRFTYTGDGTGFDPRNLCCDQLGNILITDCGYHRVHIIDRDGHFLQYLVCEEQNISYPIAIDIDSNGLAVAGENTSRKVKSFLYLQ